MRTKIITAIALLLQWLPIAGQNTLTSVCNSPRAGDVLDEKVVQYISPDEGGWNMIWDFSGMLDNQRSYRKEYVADSLGRIVGIGPFALEKYIALGDTTYLTGYEDPSVKVEFDLPMPYMSSPFEYGDSLSSAFLAHGLLNNRNALEIEGKVTIDADGAGLLILQERDTLHGVLRIHANRFLDIAISEDSLTDNAKVHQLVNEQRYQWYARGYRYPILETAIITTKVGEMPQTTSHLTLYYPPESQKLLVDSTNKEIRREDSVSVSRHSQIIDYSASVIGSEIVVTYNLKKEADLAFIVSDVNGIVYRQKVLHQQQGGNYEVTIDCNGLRRGTYALYIHADDEVHSSKVVLK